MVGGLAQPCPTRDDLFLFNSTIVEDRPRRIRIRVGKPRRADPICWFWDYDDDNVDDYDDDVTTDPDPCRKAEAGGSNMLIVGIRMMIMMMVRMLIMMVIMVHMTVFMIVIMSVMLLCCESRSHPVHGTTHRPRCLKHKWFKHFLWTGKFQQACRAKYVLNHFSRCFHNMLAKLHVVPNNFDTASIVQPETSKRQVVQQQASTSLPGQSIVETLVSTNTWPGKFPPRSGWTKCL